MGEGNFEGKERTMVEWPEGVPEEVRNAIESLDVQFIKNVTAEQNDAGQVTKVIVRREGQSIEVGLSVGSYGATEEYTIKYKGDTPISMDVHTEYDNTDAGYNAMMEFGRDRKVDL